MSAPPKAPVKKAATMKPSKPVKEIKPVKEPKPKPAPKEVKPRPPKEIKERKPPKERVDKPKPKTGVKVIDEEPEIRLEGIEEEEHKIPQQDLPEDNGPEVEVSAEQAPV